MTPIGTDLFASNARLWSIDDVADPSIPIITDEQIAHWASQIIGASDNAPGRRYLLGIAGIPGSGKSTFAAQLLKQIHHQRPGSVRLVPMDGFHLPNDKLEQLGLGSRKGSPETFDANAFVSLLQQAQLVDSKINFPIYDRKQHAVVLRDEPASKMDHQVRIVLTEGNYLLLRRQPWLLLRHVLDQCWFLHTDPQVAKRWLIGRHVQGGRSAQEAHKRYENNDGPNTYEILSNSREPDLIFSWPESNGPRAGVTDTTDTTDTTDAPDTTAEKNQ